MPLNLDAWQSCLQSHLDALFVHYILSGICNGFQIGFDYTKHIRSAKWNLSSISEHKLIVSDYLKSEQEANRVIGPFPLSNFPCQIHISPIGTIPKKNTNEINGD